jgi:predicted RNase H-like nuclease (RuvC/YqgF family)
MVVEIGLIENMEEELKMILSSHAHINEERTRMIEEKDKTIDELKRKLDMANTTIATTATSPANGSAAASPSGGGGVGRTSVSSNKAADETAARQIDFYRRQNEELRTSVDDLKQKLATLESSSSSNALID